MTRLLLDLTHTSHTRARTSIPRVCRSLHTAWPALLARFHLPLCPWWLAVAGTLVIVHGVAWTLHLNVDRIGHNEQMYSEAITWMQQHWPAHTVVAALQTSAALFYCTGYPFVRWDMIAPVDFTRIAKACTAADGPFYAVLYPSEIKDGGAFMQHLIGHWSQVGAARHVSIWRLDSPDAPP